MEDKGLVHAFQAGDREVFTELVTRYRQRIYRVARGILHDHARADEAAQDAFVKAYQGLPGFKGDSSFKTWLYRIAMNAAYDLRSREITQDRAREAAQREAGGARPDRPGPRTLERMIRDEQLEHLRAAIERLPERQRLTLTLKVREGLKYTEIAETLGCPVGTAKANFHHAVQNLRRYLGAEAAGDGASEQLRAVGEDLP